MGVKKSKMIKKKEVLLWKSKKPVKYFMGDKDKDGVMNMFDCAPNNPKKQGSQHEEIAIGFDHIKSLNTIGDVQKLEEDFLKEKKKW